MSPHSTSFSTAHHLPDRDGIRLRKPLVEKMRRDRINGCIEQLKLLLEKQLRDQEPSVRLEKADILELTVSFLRQQLRGGGLSSRTDPGQRDHGQRDHGQRDPGQRDHGQRGYSQCWRQSIHFLSGSPKREPSSSSCSVTSSVTAPLQASRHQHRHLQLVPGTQRAASTPSSPSSSSSSSATSSVTSSATSSVTSSVTAPLQAGRHRHLQLVPGTQRATSAPSSTSSGLRTGATTTGPVWRPW